MSATAGSREMRRTLQLKNEKRTDSYHRRNHMEGAKEKPAAEVRELWFNPHATRTESQTDIEDFGCERCECQGCETLRDEQTQQELDKLALIYAKIKSTKCREEYNEEVAKKYCTCNENSTDLRGELQTECDDEWHISQPRERIAKRAYEKSTTSRPPMVNRRSQRREEARRYKELSSIYTTKPRSGRQRQHRSCKSIAWCEPQVCANARANESAYTQRHRSSSRSSAKLSRDQNPKQKETTGCWEFFKIFKSDKQQQKRETYVRTKNSNQHTNKSSVRLQEYNRSSLTPEEVKLLEILRTTYARELQPEQDRRVAQRTSKADIACCALKKKTDQQTAEDAYYPTPIDTKKHVECSCGQVAEAAPEQQELKVAASIEKIARKRDKRRKSKAEEPQQQVSDAEKDNFRYPTKTTSDEIHAPIKVKSVQTELNAEQHNAEIEKSKSDDTIYASEKKSAKPKELPTEEDENKTSCCSFLGRKKAKPSTEKEKTQKQQRKKAPNKSAKNKKKSKDQASPPIGKEKIKSTNLNKRNQPAFRPKAATKPKPTPIAPISAKAPAPKKLQPSPIKEQQPPKKSKSQPSNDGKVKTRRNQPAFRPKAVPKSKPTLKHSTEKIQAEPQPAGKSSLKKKRSSETTGCMCLKPKKQGKRSTFDESSIKRKDEKHTTPKISKKTPVAVKSQEKIEKNVSKKPDETKRKPTKGKTPKQLDEETSETSLCCSCQLKSKKNKQKELEEPKSLPSKSASLEKDKRGKSVEVKQIRLMPRPRGHIQKDKSRKKEDIKQEKAPRVKPKKSVGSKPTLQTAKRQESIEKQASETSVWACCSSGKHGKIEKLDKPKKEDTKTKSKDHAQKGAEKKLEGSKQKTKLKKQEKVTEQSSKTSGWSCCSSGDKENDESEKTPSKSKSSDKTERDGLRKLDESKQKASKTTKSIAKAEEKTSKTLGWSCCSSGDKEKTKQTDESKKTSSKNNRPDKAGKDRPKTPENSKQKASKTIKRQEKVEEQPSKLSDWSCCSGVDKKKVKQQDESKRSSPRSKSPDKPRKRPPKKLDDSKQKASKTAKGQENVEKKPSETSGWSCCSSGDKEKTKQQVDSKKSSPKSKSPDQARMDRSKKSEDPKQKASKATKGQENAEKKSSQTSGWSCCSSGDKEKAKPKEDSKKSSPRSKSLDKDRKDRLKKADDFKQKPTKALKGPEKKPSQTSGWSCCSSGDKEKIKQQDESKRYSPRSRSPHKVQKNHPKKLEDSKQKASKTTKDKEKVEEKPSKTSCWSCCSNGDKKKTKQQDSSKESSPRDKSPDKARQDRPKKLEYSEQKTSKTIKDQKNVEEKPSKTSCWSSCSIGDKHKTKEKETSKTKQKSLDKAQKDRPKQKPLKTTIGQEKVEEKPSKTSCWSYCSSRDKNKSKRKEESKPTPTKRESPDKVEKDQSKKLEESKQKLHPTRNRVQVQTQPSKTSCWSCCSCRDKDKTKQIDEPGKKHLNAKGREKTSTQIQSPNKAPMDRYRKLEKPDKPKKLDDSKLKGSRTKNQESVQERLSKTSCWSCCSCGDKGRKEKLNEPKMNTSQRMKQRHAQADEPKNLDDAKRKGKEKKKPQKQSSKTSCSCCAASNDEEIQSNKSKASISGSRSSYKAKGPIDSRQKSNEQNKPDNVKQKSTKIKSKDEQKKPSKKFSLFWKRCKKDKSKVAPTEQRTASTRTESSGQLKSALQTDQTRSKMTKSTTSKTQQDKGKHKSSKMSIRSCCSGGEPKANAGRREELQPEEACAYKTKPEDISYCKALYQELENIITQQNKCPIQISQSQTKKHNKKPENKKFNCKRKTKQDKQSERKLAEAKQDRKENKENKRNKNETHNVAKTKPKKHTEHQKKSQAESKNSDNDKITEVDYVPDYVLGKPFELRNRTLSYSLFTNSRGRKKLHNQDGHEVDSQA